MDFDPRDYDSRDNERHVHARSRGGRTGSSDRDREDDWSQPGTRTRDHDGSDARSLGRGPANERQASDGHGKNWLFCWTEVGARYVGILQSLLVTCRLHRIHPYDYPVDVLQPIDRHPASQVHLLTPRLWKEHFAADPIRAPLDTIRQ